MITDRPIIHALYAESGFACAEFIQFPSIDGVVVQRYTTRFDKSTLRSWLAPEGREEQMTKEQAREIWKHLAGQGWKQRTR